jgi:hypothetical protein
LPREGAAARVEPPAAPAEKNDHPDDGFTRTAISAMACAISLCCLAALWPYAAAVLAIIAVIKFLGLGKASMSAQDR